MKNEIDRHRSFFHRAHTKSGSIHIVGDFVIVGGQAIAADVVLWAAGVRGCQMLLAPADLVRLTDARRCPIAKE